ncbi:MAG: hypothetical protein HUJ27_13550 [Rhodobacteraceae bacterium]|nr:hypothetical protein [Paracoccaceae bacterium]
MKKLVLTFPLILAACVSPLNQCIRSASAEYDALVSEQQTLRQNVARGYAIHTQSEPYQTASTCTREVQRIGRMPDGSSGQVTVEESYPCTTTSYRTVETPIAIDTQGSMDRIAEIERQLPAARARRDVGVEQCRAANPA